MKLITLSKSEREKFYRNRDKIISKIPTYLEGEVLKDLSDEISMGLFRDIQAQRIPPNVKVPSRKKPFEYLKTVYQNTNSLKIPLVSFFSPGSWTSSGGSFKLAEESGYDLTEILLDKEKQNGKSILIEIGAGYAGFKSETPQGISKLVNKAESKMGNTIFANFTNLSNWHEGLPNGVKEFPGYVARDIFSLVLENKLDTPDVIYSQCAAYFEAFIGLLVQGSSEILNEDGLLIFNAPKGYVEKILSHTKKLTLENKIKLKGSNDGDLYVFRKSFYKN